ncbi:MAG: hypothetical protein H6581_30650 [Bacteroidia bacterium]|nr:hypothetical protein [Bacteroidia bacterium]
MNAKKMIAIMLGAMVLGYIAWYFWVYVPMEEQKAQRLEEKRQKEMLQGPFSEDAEREARKDLKGKIQAVDAAADSLQGLLDSFSRKHPKADSLMKLME